MAEKALKYFINKKLTNHPANCYICSTKKGFLSMAWNILIFLSAFLVVFICTPSLIRVSIRKNLTDAPGDLRKLHTRSIPTLGGVMIFAGTLFAFTLFLPTIYAYLIKGDGAIPPKGCNQFKLPCFFIG